MATVVDAPPAAPATTISPEVVSRREASHPERLANSIQVCLERTPTFYSRIGRRMLHGSSDSKPTFDEVVITGLGMATRTAISTASIMERDRQAFIKNIETSYFASTRGASRRLPKVTITMVKNPDAPNMDPPVEAKKEEPAAPTQL